MPDVLNIRIRGDVQRQRVRQLADRVPEDWTVAFNPPKRTLDQNAKLHAMIGDLIKAKPEGRVMTKEDWKAALMKLAGFKVRFVQDLDDAGGITVVGFKSSRLNKREMADLITTIQEYGDRHGVTWSEPNPYEEMAA